MAKKKLSKGDESRIAARKRLKEYRPMVPTGQIDPTTKKPLLERKSFYYQKSDDPAAERANRASAVEEARRYVKRLSNPKIDPDPAILPGTVDWYIEYRVKPLKSDGRKGTVAATNNTAVHLSRIAGGTPVWEFGKIEISETVRHVDGSASLKNKVRDMAFLVNEIAADEDPRVKLVSKRWVKRAPEKAPRLTPYDPKDMLRVALSVPSQYRPAALLLCLGVRAGESVGPLGTDLGAWGVVRIDRQEEEGELVDTLKNDDSHRSIPLPQAMFDLVKPYRSGILPLTRTRKGGPVLEASLRRSVVSALRRLGLPVVKHRPLHIFRHSVSTWLENEGCPEGIRLAILGQSKDAVKDRYNHHGPAATLPWIERLWEAMEGAEAEPPKRRGNEKTHRAGMANGRAKVDRKTAHAILAALAEPGAKVMAVGKTFGVAPKTVRLIRDGKHWTVQDSTLDVVAATTLRVS